MTVPMPDAMKSLRIAAVAFAALIAIFVGAAAAQEFPFGSQLEPYADGVLKITLPKAAEARTEAKRIEIR